MEKVNYTAKNVIKKKSDFIKGRKYKLTMLQALPLDLKITKTKMLIQEATDRYGDSVYISYSGSKDSTVISHISRQIKPDILHIRVVTDEGYPLFSKVVANAIRTYRRAKTPQTKQNSIEYMERRFKKYMDYKDKNISDKCCEKLKKTPIKQAAHKLGMEYSIMGLLAEESRQREMDWVNFGCNVFDVKKDNQCRPISFWTEDDIYEYIKIHDVKISELYNNSKRIFYNIIYIRFHSNFFRYFTPF